MQGDYTLTYSAIDQAGNEADPVTRTVKVESFDTNLGLLTFAINEDNNSLSLISCDVSASGGVEVPAVWDGKPVTGIGEGAFAGCSQVASVLLPEGISTIGDGAFAGCVLLTEVSLPTSLDSLGDGLFAQCEALESIRFLGDAPDIVAGGALADDASAAVVYVEALASGFGTLFGGLEVVRPDVIAPVISLNGGATISQEAMVAYQESGATATDDVDGAVDVTVAGTVDVTVLGDYILSYVATDSAGNQSTVERTVQVVDTTPPVITLNGGASYLQFINTVFEDPGASAFDALDGEVAVSISGDEIDVSSVGDYVLTYSATDASGNTAEASRTVTVGDGLGIHSVVVSQSMIRENGGASTIVVNLTQPALQRVFLFVEASLNSRILLSDSILSVAEGDTEVRFTVTALDDELVNGDEAITLNVRSLYTELASVQITVRDDEASHLGVVSDGLVSGASVFFDMNANGVMDDGEPSTTTDKQGAYQLNLPVSQYDQNSDGVVDSKDGQLVAIGGIDTATGLQLENPLTAPPTATVLNPLTTLVSALLASQGDLDEQQAAAQVSQAFGLNQNLDLLNFDMINEASDENVEAVAVIQAAAAVQDTIVQLSSLISDEEASGAQAVTSAIAERIGAGQSLDLESANDLEAIVSASADKAQTSVTTEITQSVAKVVASNNQIKSQAVASAGSVSEAAIEVSRIQSVTQSVVSESISAVAAGADSVDNFEADFDAAAVEALVGEAVAGPLAGLDARSGTFGFSDAAYVFDEAGKGQKAIKVQRTDGNLGPIELIVTASASNAAAGVDFSSQPIRVSFADQEISQIIPASALILDDDSQEETESFQLSLAFVEGTPSGAKLGAQTTASVQILDNDSVGVFQFAEATYRFSEGSDSEGSVAVERLGGTKGEVTLAVTAQVVAGSAVPSEDYVLTTSTLKFGDGDVKRLVKFDITDDSLLEGSEFISLTLAVSSTDLSGATVGDRNAISVLLESDDINAAPVVSSIEDQEVPEDGSLTGVTFTVSDDYTSSEALVVRATSSNPHLLPNSGILVSREDEVGSYSLTITPVAQRFGSALITVSVSDGQLTTETSFSVMVDESNDPPTISAIPGFISAVDATVVVPFTINDEDDGASSLFIYIQTGATQYLANGDLIITGSGVNRQLVINQKGNAQGKGVFNMIVVDQDGLSASRQFEVQFAGPVELPKLNLKVADAANIELSWEGGFRLFFTEEIGQPFAEVIGAQSPYTAPIGRQGFYKLQP